MDLPAAIRVTTAVAHFAGTSDAKAAMLAATDLRRGVALAVPLLDGGTSMTPAHLLLHLAYATRFAYDRTVLDAYQQWALFRYIGAFDHESRPRPGFPRLQLSDAARRIVGNQRRVFSEDLGVGTSSFLAREWAAFAFGPGAVHLIDFDVAVDAGLLHRGPGRRADYVIVKIDGRRLHLLGLLEAKGSSQASYSRAQLRKGAAQIEATWGHQAPALRGLVVATYSSARDLRYVAAEIAPRRPPPHPSFAIDSPLARRLLAGTWAKFADIADDDMLYARVAPLRLRSRREVGMAAPRLRTERMVEGRHYEGTEMAIALPGGRLRVFLGADHQTLDELRQGSTDGAAEELATAGRLARFRRSIDIGEQSRSANAEEPSPDPQRPSGTTSEDHVEVASEDGVALTLDAEG